MPRAALRDRAGIWLLGALALAYIPMLAGRILFFRDLAHYAYPMRKLAADSIARGELLAWNPMQGLGFSSIANPQYGLFYPPHLVFQVLQPATYLTWFWFVHVLWGGMGAIAVARGLGVARATSLVAGLAWSLSGFTTGEWTAGLRLPAGAWIPWVGVGFLALARAVTDGDWRSWARGVAAAASPIAMSALFGELFVTTMALGVGVGIVIAARLPESTAGPNDGSTERVPGAGAGDRSRPLRPPLRRLAAATAAALAIGVLIAGIVVLTGRAGAGGTARAANLPREVAERCSFHPWRLVETLAPGVFGEPQHGYAGRLLGVGADCLDRKPLVWSVYLGGSVVALALAALGRGRRRAWALAGLAGFSCLCALGSHTAVHGLLRLAVPPLGLMRHPEKYFALVVAFVSVLAALGAERLLPATGRGPRWRIAVPSGLMLALALAAALGPQGDLPRHAQRAALHGGLAALAVLAVVLLGRALGRWKLPVLAVIVLVDLASAAWPLLDFASARLASYVPPAASMIHRRHEGRVEPPRIYRPFSVDESVAAAVPARSVYEGESRWIETLVSNTVNAFDIATVVGYDPALPPDIEAVIASGRAVGGTALVRLLSADFAILPSRADAFDMRFVISPVGGAAMYRVTNPLPRAFVAGAAVEREGHDALRALFDAEIVDGARAIVRPGSAGLLARAAAGRAGECRIERFESTRLEATCRLDRAGLAVFVEQYDPGWRATVDGREAPILRANLVMRAVQADAGRHSIVMTFHPPGLAAGAALSAIGLLALGACAVFGLRRRPELRAKG